MNAGPAVNRDRWFATLRWALLLVAVSDLALLKAELVTHSHSLLAWLMVAAMLSFCARLIQLVASRSMWSHEPLRQVARIAVAAGVCVALGGGLANWLMGLQGYVILTEHEKARLHGGTELQGFESGPLGDIADLDLVLGLEELDLEPAGHDGFVPVSHLQVWRGHERPVTPRISPTESGAVGSLRFYQGAFGFAPRIVILRDGEPQQTLFDGVVPFLTERHGAQGIRFSGSFTVEGEKLRVEGVINLESLDSAMRGHATLDLVVTKEEQPLGSGSLLPGRFAELTDGYRIGFAGLEMWSEIVLSRRSYGAFVLLGTLLAGGGALLLALPLGRRT